MLWVWYNFKRSSKLFVKSAIFESKLFSCKITTPMSHVGIIWYRMVSCTLLWYGIAIIFSTIIATPKTSNGHPSLLFLIGALVEHRLYAMDVPLYLLCLLWGSLVVLLASACLRGENHTLPPRRVAADDDIFDLAENGSTPCNDSWIFALRGAS